MKKFLLVSLSLLSVFSALSAKELTFYLGDEKIPANGTVNFEGYEEFPSGSKTEYYIDPQVFIMKDASDNVSLKMTSNYDVQLCIGGQCEAATVVEKPNLSFDANTKTDLLLECSVFLDKDAEVVLPEINVLIEAWYVDDPTNVYSMRINMGDVAGLSNIEKNVVEVKVVNKSLTYNLDGASTISIFNLAGTTVASHKVSGRGSVSLASLPAGAYLYRAEGVKGCAGKFIIR